MTYRPGPSEIKDIGRELEAVDEASQTDGADSDRLMLLLHSIAFEETPDADLVLWWKKRVHGYFEERMTPEERVRGIA